MGSVTMNAKMTERCEVYFGPGSEATYRLLPGQIVYIEATASAPRRARPVWGSVQLSHRISALEAMYRSRRRSTRIVRRPESRVPPRRFPLASDKCRRSVQSTAYHRTLQAGTDFRPARRKCTLSAHLFAYRFLTTPSFQTDRSSILRLRNARRSAPGAMLLPQSESRTWLKHQEAVPECPAMFARPVLAALFGPPAAIPPQTEPVLTVC